MLIGPQRRKKTDDLTVFLCFFGSAHVKAVRRTLIKLSPASTGVKAAGKMFVKFIPGDRPNRERGEHRTHRGHLPLLRQGRCGHRCPLGHDGRKGLQDQGGPQESKAREQGNFKLKPLKNVKYEKVF